MNKNLLFSAVTSFLPVLFPAGAEDFESYSDAAALRRIWKEFDAGNPAPEIVQPGVLNGKAMQIEATRDYSLIWREMAIPDSSRPAGVRLTVCGDAANPGDAVMTVVLRSEKNGTELGRRAVPLHSAQPQTIAFPVQVPAGQSQAALLLMFNKSGGTVKATVDDIGFTGRELVEADGFDRVGSTEELRQEWPAFDGGNPAPEEMQLISVKGEAAMLCKTGSRTYAVLKHRVAPPRPGVTGITIRLAGRPGNAKSGVIVFGARRNENEANFAQMQIVPPATPGEFTLHSPEFAGLESFLIVISFHKTAGRFDVQIEETALEYLR